MDGLNLRSAVAGVVLIVVLVLSAVFTGSGSGNSPYEFHAIDTSWITDNPRIEVVAEEQMLDSEGSVISAIFQDQVLDGECHTAMALNSEPRTFYSVNYSYSPDYVYGVTWGMPHDDNTIKKMIIHCDVSEDVTAPDWDECGTFYEIKVQYPLKSEIVPTDTINDTIRGIVSNLISTYLTDAKERAAGCRFTELPDRHFNRRGFFEIDAFVTFANEGLFSAHFQTGVHDPGANTSNDYVETLNIDLSTGKRFSLADMLKSGEESFRALQRVAIAQNNYLYFQGLRDSWSDGLMNIHTLENTDYEPELLEELEFVLTENAIVLDCELYCGNEMVAGLLYKEIPLEIPFRQLVNFWDPEGPLRHISPS